MKITSSAVSLNVKDVDLSVDFLSKHFGFRAEMAADGFASLIRDDVGMSVVFLRQGLSTLPADQRDDHARGLILAFVVDDLEGELARLQTEEVTITMPLTYEEWGERAFQVRDPNGVIVELLDWNACRAGRRVWSRRPRTAKGWLITVALAMAALALKLIAGTALILADAHLVR